MAKIHTEVREVYGKLVTSFQDYEMLDEFPQVSNIPFFLRQEGVLSFYVILEGYGTHIYLKWSDDIAIEHYPVRIEREVKFYVDDGLPTGISTENIKVDSLE
jgi:hypothetical protein